MSGEMYAVNKRIKPKRTKPKRTIVVFLAFLLLVSIAVWYVLQQAKPQPEPPQPEPPQPEPPQPEPETWKISSCLRTLRWYPDRPVFSVQLPTNNYGEWSMGLAALPMNCVQFIMPGSCRRSDAILIPDSFGPQDRALAAFMQSLNPGQNAVLCPDIGETYASQQALGYPQRRKCYVPYSAQCPHINFSKLTKYLVRTYPPVHLMLAARTRLSMIDATSSQAWKLGLSELKPRAIGLFIRRSKHDTDRNTSHELLKEQILRFNSQGYQVVLMGDHPNDLSSQLLSDSDGDYLDLTCKTVRAIDSDASIGIQFFVLREIFIRGVRNIIGMWSGWLITSLILGFTIEVLPSHIPDRARIMALFQAFQPSALKYL